MTLEGQIIKFADRIAYINHDIDDSLRANIITVEMLPKDCLKVLGHTHGERINTMIKDVIINSYNKDKISMSEEVKHYTDKLRDFMFKNVYFNKKAKSEEDKAKKIIKLLYEYYMNNFNELPREHKSFYDDLDCDTEDIVCDYIAGMTDRYVINKYKEIFVPKSWNQY